MLDDFKTLGPTYTIHRYTDQIFKICKFKSTHFGIKSDISTHYDVKLDNSLSRTRALVLAKALCNRWSWFVTLTIDKSKFQRDDLALYVSTFTQWLRDRRKKGLTCAYLLVPELHDDGKSWHMHGFMEGDFPELIPFSKVKFPVKRSLIDGGFYNWPAYQEKFGFCSFGKIRSPVRSAFYISKYITKDHSRLVSSVGSKMYYCSKGLNTSVKHSEVYGDSQFLDSFLTADYDFCKVGLTKVSDNLDWTFSLDLADIPFESWEPLFDDVPENVIDLSDALFYVNLSYEQLAFSSVPETEE